MFRFQKWRLKFRCTHLQGMKFNLHKNTLCFFALLLCVRVHQMNITMPCLWCWRVGHRTIPKSGSLTFVICFVHRRHHLFFLNTRPPRGTPPYFFLLSFWPIKFLLEYAIHHLLGVPSSLKIRSHNLAVNSWRSCWKYCFRKSALDLLEGFSFFLRARKQK